MSKSDKRLRDAEEAVAIVTGMIHASDVTIDICIGTGALLMHTGRALGYRARVQPTRVRTSMPDGQAGPRRIGYGLSDEGKAHNRYDGHLLCLWDDQVALDVTAPQFGTSVFDPTVPHFGSPIPPLWFEVPRSFVKGEPYDLMLSSGWIINYVPFDDGGDWVRDSDADGSVHRAIQEMARLVARRIRL